MFFQSVAVDEDVVNECGAKYVQVLEQCVVTEVLEGGWGIGESKRHNLVLVVP